MEKGSGKIKNEKHESKWMTYPACNIPTAKAEALGDVLQISWLGVVDGRHLVRGSIPAGNRSRCGLATRVLRC